MKKQNKKYEVKVKSNQTYQDKNGDEKNRYYQIGDIILFSENHIPDDISIKLTMNANPDLHYSVFEKREFKQSREESQFDF